MRISILIFIYTLHFAYLKVYTKFHNPKLSSCWENSDAKRPCFYEGVTEEKNEKEGKISFSVFILIYTIHSAYLKVYTQYLNTGTGYTRSREKSDRHFHWREKKWTNKGTDAQYVAVFCSIIQLITIKLCIKFQNPKSSTCWEIFDRKKCPYVFYRSDRRKIKNWKKKTKWGWAS